MSNRDTFSLRVKISCRTIGICVVPVVAEYRTAEFYDKKKGQNVYSAFPCGVMEDANYDESMKAFLFLLNSRCNVSLQKTAQFVRDVTDGALSPSVGMINGLCREFYTSVETPQDQNPFNPNLRNRNPSIRLCLNIRQDKVLLRVPCNHTLFFPSRETMSVS